MPFFKRELTPDRTVRHSILLALQDDMARRLVQVLPQNWLCVVGVFALMPISACRAAGNHHLDTSLTSMLAVWCVCLVCHLPTPPTGSRDEGGCRVARPVRPHPCAVMSGLINGSMVCYRRAGLGGAVSGTIGPRSFGCLACNFECNAGPVCTWVKWLLRNPLAAGSTANVGEQICSTTMQSQLQYGGLGTCTE